MKTKQTYIDNYPSRDEKTEELIFNFIKDREDYGVNVFMQNLKLYAEDKKISEHKLNSALKHLLKAKKISKDFNGEYFILK